MLLGQAVPVPEGIIPCGYAALLLSLCLAFLGNRLAGYAATVCAVLAVLYSHPQTKWKGHPLLGPWVNVVGYGLLSPFAGWAVVQVAPDLRTIMVWLLGALGVLGCYFIAQAFQQEEDRSRGYRTLVATHGPSAVLLAGRLCIGLGLLGGVGLGVVGWLPRLCLLAVPMGLWVDNWLRCWSEQPRGGDERWAQGLVWRLLSAAVAGIALAYVDYGLALLTDEPVAGLGTARGHPFE